MKVELPRYRCTHCGYEWIPKKEEIYECPSCHCSLEKYPPEKVKRGRPKKGVEVS